MVQLLRLLTSTVLFLGYASALVVPQSFDADTASNNTNIEDPSIEARKPPLADIGVLMCPKKNFEGDCIFKLMIENKCVWDKYVNINTNSWLMSMKPNPGTACAVYKTLHCKGNEFLQVDYPGQGIFKDLSYSGRMASYKCWHV